MNPIEMLWAATKRELNQYDNIKQMVNLVKRVKVELLTQAHKGAHSFFRRSQKYWSLYSTGLSSAHVFDGIRAYTGRGPNSQLFASHRKIETAVEGESRGGLSTAGKATPAEARAWQVGAAAMGQTANIPDNRLKDFRLWLSRVELVAGHGGRTEAGIEVIEGYADAFLSTTSQWMLGPLFVDCAKCDEELLPLAPALNAAAGGMLGDAEVQPAPKKAAKRAQVQPLAAMADMEVDAPAVVVPAGGSPAPAVAPLPAGSIVALPAGPGLSHQGKVLSGQVRVQADLLVALQSAREAVFRAQLHSRFDTDAAAGAFFRVAVVVRETIKFAVKRQ